VTTLKGRLISAVCGFLTGCGFGGCVYDYYLINLNIPLASQTGIPSEQALVVKIGMTIIVAIVTIFTIVTELKKDQGGETDGISSRNTNSSTEK